MPNQTIDSLHAYQGADRRLRDAIERVVFREVLQAQAGRPGPGTIYAANEIMALVKEATRAR